MKISKLSFFFVFTCSLAYAELTPSQTYNFGNGVDYDSIETEVDPTRSPDQSNVIGDRLGAAGRRDGSKRFIDQAVSTNPVNTTYSTYISTTNGGVIKCLFAFTGSMILVSTRSEINPVWITVKSDLAGHNQDFSCVTMNNRVIMTGSKLTDPIWSYDVSGGSLTTLLRNDGSTMTALVYAKYLVTSKNYLIAANLRDIKAGSTYYASRFVYSILNQASSMTVARYIDYRTDDGEGITGVGESHDKVNFFKPTSIAELEWGTALDLTALGGDWTFKQVINGFGNVAPKTLINTALFYGFLSKDGYRLWDNRTSNLIPLSEQAKLITSKNVKTPIERMLNGGNYAIASAIYYPKREWLVFAFNDPIKKPDNKNNSFLIYDLVTDEWWPQHNWLGASFAVLDRNGDDGSLVMGDAADGYVHYIDVDTAENDSRKEKSINSMDIAAEWTGATSETTFVREGAAAMRLNVTTNTLVSTMTFMSPINSGQWLDNSEMKKSDKISFKILAISTRNITSFRVDLEVHDIGGAFDDNFTSVTIPVNSLTLGTSIWTTVEIKLSSFPTQRNWTDLDIEDLPFANAYTYYGVRIVMRGTDSSSLVFDDLRFVQGTQAPLNPYRFTKMFSLDRSETKTFSEILYTRDKARSSNLFIDIYNDFGSIQNTEEDVAEIPKEIFVFQFDGRNNITKLDSIDFSVKDSTYFSQSSFDDRESFSGVADAEYLYFPNRADHTINRMLRSSMTVFDLTYGSIGSGTTNHYVTHQISLTDSRLYQCDLGNNRIKENSKSDLNFVQMDGELGLSATNYHSPTGICSDRNNLWVADEGNARIKKLSISTFGIVLLTQFDYDMVGESRILNDERNLYLVYDKGSPLSPNHNDVVVLKIDKNNLKVVQKKILRPDGVSELSVSTYGITGDPGLLGKYLFVPFFDLSSGRYYIQKLLRDDLSLAYEFSSLNSFYSSVGDGLAYEPSLKNKPIEIGTEGKYLQLRFYDDNALDNDWKLYNMTLLVKLQQLKGGT